jgi:hypothetical protein
VYILFNYKCSSFLYSLGLFVVGKFGSLDILYLACVVFGGLNQGLYMDPVAVEGVHMCGRREGPL